MIVDFETSKGRFAFVAIEDKWLKDKLSMSMGIEQEMLSDNEYYHPLNISIKGFVKDLTEEQWSEVVDSDNNYFYREYFDITWATYPYETATESGKSLMESLDIHIGEPYKEDFEGSPYSFEYETWKNKQETTGNWLLIKYGRDWVHRTTNESSTIRRNT